MTNEEIKNFNENIEKLVLLLNNNINQLQTKKKVNNEQLGWFTIQLVQKFLNKDTDCNSLIKQLFSIGLLKTKKSKGIIKYKFVLNIPERISLLKQDIQTNKQIINDIVKNMETAEKNILFLNNMIDLLTEKLKTNE